MGHRVFAFEPNKETWKYLTGSVAVNNLQTNVSLFAYALMDKRHHCVRLSTPARDNIGHTIVQVEKNESLSECQDESKVKEMKTLLGIVAFFLLEGNRFVFLVFDSFLQECLSSLKSLSF